MAGEKLSPDSFERGPGKAASKLPTAYGDVHTAIVELLETARRAAARSVNALMTASYWEIGRRIVEFEQGGKDRAKYGEALIERLAADGRAGCLTCFGWTFREGRGGASTGDGPELSTSRVRDACGQP